MYPVVIINWVQYLGLAVVPRDLRDPRGSSRIAREIPGRQLGDCGGFLGGLGGSKRALRPASKPALRPPPARRPSPPLPRSPWRMEATIAPLCPRWEGFLGRSLPISFPIRYRFLGLSWETSTFRNCHPEDSRRSGSGRIEFESTTCTRQDNCYWRFYSINWVQYLGPRDPSPSQIHGTSSRFSWTS